MMKKTFTAAAVAAMASTAVMAPEAVASCGPAKRVNSGPAKSPCNPCAATNPCAAGNPCNPSAAASPCGAGTPTPLTEHKIKDVNTGYFDNVAIRGYDPVAYFTVGKAVKGSKRHSYKWLGAVWHFANDKHRQTFADKPTKYAPRYGGYCAIGIGFNALVPNIDPKAWIIVKGKLYLQYSKSAVQDFKSDTDGWIAKADTYWRNAKVKTTK